MPCNFIWGCRRKSTLQPERQTEKRAKKEAKAEFTAKLKEDQKWMRDHMQTRSTLQAAGTELPLAGRPAFPMCRP